MAHAQTPIDASRGIHLRGGRTVPGVRAGQVLR
jgi:hypothetical protein